MTRKQTPGSKEEFEPVWEEQYPQADKNGASADIVLRDILWDALRQV